MPGEVSGAADAVSSRQGVSARLFGSAFPSFEFAAGTFPTSQSRYVLMGLMVALHTSSRTALSSPPEMRSNRSSVS